MTTKLKQATKFDNVYLSELELAKIYELDLSSEPVLDKCRDIFIFICWTGIRLNDLCNLKPKHIIQHSDGKYLKLTPQKSLTDVVIPLHHIAEIIYLKHDMEFPKFSLWERKHFSVVLKEIAKRAGIDKNITYHTARRSFATNCYLMGVPINTIMAVTGHKSKKVFSKFVIITKLEHAEIMRKAFNNRNNHGNGNNPN